MTAARRKVLFLDTLGYDNYEANGRGPSCLSEFEVLLLCGLDGLPAVQRPEIRRVLGTDARDDDSIRTAARFLIASTGGTVDHVVAVAERRVLLAASLRDEFGVPGTGYAGALLMRDKVLMKAHLQSHGIRVPPYAEFSVEAGADLLADSGRVIVKPRLEAGSVGVHDIDSIADLHALGRRVDPATYEVEAFIDGRLFHIDSLVDRGSVVIATAGESISPTDNVVRLLPYKDISVPPGALLDALLAFNTRVIGTFPDFTGVTHHEVFVDTSGALFFCEIGGRPGGGGTSPGFKRRTGQDLFDWSMRAQLGLDLPRPTGVDPALVGYAMIYEDPTRGPSALRVPSAQWIVDVQRPSGAARADRPPRSWSEASLIVTVEGRDAGEVNDRLDEVLRMSRYDGGGPSRAQVDRKERQGG